jgi:SHS2 domain-containing protein
VSWRTFEHPADLGLLVDAPDGPSLFVEAGLAYFSLVCDVDRVLELERYELTGEAFSVEDLLVDWLNDLIFLVEGRGVVCSGISFAQWSPTGYAAALAGEPVDPKRHVLRSVVKAATYHGLAVSDDASGWHARVILDV